MWNLLLCMAALVTLICCLGRLVQLLDLPHWMLVVMGVSVCLIAFVAAARFVGSTFRGNR